MKMMYEDGVYDAHRMDGSLFNERRQRAQIMTKEWLIRDHLFTVDDVHVAYTEQALQRITSCFADASRLIGRDVSLRKTEVLHPPISRDKLCPPQITSGDAEVNST